MEKSVIVREWCKANPTPIQELCPEINQYFANKDGYVIWNSRTLLRENVDHKPNHWNSGMENIVSVRREYEGFYVRYIKDLDALEFARVYLPGGRGQNGIAKIWNYNGYYENRVIVFRNDVNAYCQDGTLLESGRYYSKGLCKILKEFNHRCVVSMESYDELKRYDPNVVLRYWSGEPVTAKPYPWMYEEWYRKSFVERNTSKHANQLLSYDLDDAHFNVCTSKISVIVFQKIDNDYSVLRIYNKTGAGYWDDVMDNFTDNTCEEKGRLFISAKGKPTFIVKDYSNKWKITSHTPYDCDRPAYIANVDDMAQCNALKYILPCIDEDKCSISTFINILRHPILEQLSKAGYKNIAKRLSIDNQVKAKIKEYFYADENKQPMFKMLKVNKFVLNAAEHSEYPLQTVEEIKYICDDYDATKVSEEICNMVAKFLSNGHGWYGISLRELTKNRARYWYYNRNRELEPISDIDKEWIIRLLKMEEKHEGCVTLYRDLLRTYRNLINPPEVDLYDVHNYDDILRLHDFLVEFDNQERMNRQRAYEERNRKEQEKIKVTFEKLQKDRIEKFEYENDKYCVRVPRELSEIQEEGYTLHHCVAGYTNNHALGHTNILFLREKSDETKPFFTIEIDNNNRVVQIHGFGNRWLGNVPDAVPFVFTYLNKIGATFDNKLLLNKGTGYSAGTDNLDKSYLKMIA